MKFQKIIVYTLIITLLTGYTLTKEKTLDDIMKTVEDTVSQIVNRAKQGYLTMCTNCDICSTHSCSPKLSKKIDCEHDFGTPSFCTHCKGQRLEKRDAFVNFSSKYEIVDPNSQLTRQVVCFTSKMVEDMSKLRNENGDYMRWSYIGTSNGVFRVTPGSSNCGSYDHRYRPWYTSAVGGARNIILLIDSGNGIDINQLEIEKEFTKRILATLNNIDRVSLIVYSNSLEVSSILLEEGSEVTKLKLNNIVDSIRLSSYPSSLFSAISKVNEILASSKSMNLINLNTDVSVILLSSGKYIDTNDSINNEIRLRQKDLALTRKVSYYTYSINNNLNFNNVLPELACNSSGSYYDIKNYDDIIPALDEYFRVYSIAIQNKLLIWTEPYLDESIGSIATAAMAVYDESVTPNFLIGVVGIDIDVNELVKKYGTLEEITKKFRDYSLRIKSDIKLGVCQIESLRTNKCLNPNICITSEMDIKRSFTKCPTDFPKVWCEDEKSFTIVNSLPEDMTCCRCILKSSVALIAVGWVLFGLTLFVWIYILCCKGNKGEIHQEYRIPEHKHEVVEEKKNEILDDGPISDNKFVNKQDEAIDNNAA